MFIPNVVSPHSFCSTYLTLSLPVGMGDTGDVQRRNGIQGCFLVSSWSCFLHRTAAFIWSDLLAKLAFLILKVMIPILSLEQVSDRIRAISWPFG